MKELTRIWWMMIVRGTVAILFGLAAIVWPQKSLLIATSIFGLFILIDGVLITIASLFGIRRLEHWWVLSLKGLSEILFGVVLFSWTEITVAILFFLLALWILYVGILLVVIALINRKERYGTWTLIAGGIISILFSIVLLSEPALSLKILVVITGLFLLISGILGVSFGLDLRLVERTFQRRGRRGVDAS